MSSLKLDEFLKISGRELLDHAGKISAEIAKEKAHVEFGKYAKKIDLNDRSVDRHFEESIKNLPKPLKSSGRKSKKG